MCLCKFLCIIFYYVDHRMCFIRNGTVHCATRASTPQKLASGVFFFFFSLLSVMQLGQRFKICMFCFKYSEYLVHGLWLIIKMYVLCKDITFRVFLSRRFTRSPDRLKAWCASSPTPKCWRTFQAGLWYVRRLSSPLGRFGFWFFCRCCRQIVKLNWKSRGRKLLLLYIYKIIYFWF